MGETATEPRVFSEDEAYAIAADRVARETSELNEQITALQAEKAELATKLDVEIAAREAAEQQVTAAKAEHEEFVAGIEAEKARLARKDERISKVREAASHLSDEFFADQGRVERILAMDDDAFDGYIADLKDAATHAPQPDGQPPRETAMHGDSVKPKGSDSALGARDFLMRGFIAPEEG